MRDRLTLALYLASTLVAIAVVIAAGNWLIGWIVGNGTAGVWKAALALITATGVGAGTATKVVEHLTDRETRGPTSP